MPKDHKRNTSSMQEARQKIVQEKYNTLKTVLEDMIHNKEEVTVARVCELSGLSKSYLYQNEKAKKLFNEAKALDEGRAKYNHISPNTHGKLDINPKMRHDDMLLQYEETKRKLYETYMMTFRLIKEENKRLKKAIKSSQKRLEYLQSMPKIKLHIIPNCKNRGFLSYSITTPKGQKLYNGIGEDTIKGIIWGTYTLFAKHHSFELATHIDGSIIEKKDDCYLLTITDTIKEEITIDILMNVTD